MAMQSSTTAYMVKHLERWQTHFQPKGLLDRGVGTSLPRLHGLCCFAILLFYKNTQKASEPSALMGTKRESGSGQQAHHISSMGNLTITVIVMIIWTK